METTHDNTEVMAAEEVSHAIQAQAAEIATITIPTVATEVVTAIEGTVVVVVVASLRTVETLRLTADISGRTEAEVVVIGSEDVVVVIGTEEVVVVVIVTVEEVVVVLVVEIATEVRHAQVDHANLRPPTAATNKRNANALTNQKPPPVQPTPNHSHRELAPGLDPVRNLIVHVPADGIVSSIS